MNLKRSARNIASSLLELKTNKFFKVPANRIAHNLPRELVISLTSYPPRFEKLPATIKCLLSQSLSFDRLVLWISHEDRGLLTREILELQESGLEIRYCENLRSFKKIIPSLREFPDSFLVTADDDVYYWPSWLSELVACWKENGEAICHRAHFVLLDAHGIPLEYNRWEFETSRHETSRFVFQTGIGGVLYPPGIFHPDVLKEDIFRRYCFAADDVWLYWMMRRNGGCAKKTPKAHRMFTWQGTQESGLYVTNVLNGGNDQCIQNMLSLYGFP